MHGMRVMLPLLLLVSTARAELLVLTRDGALHRGAEFKDAPKLPVEKPRAIAPIDALQIAIAHEKGLTILAGKNHTVPGKQADLVQLASAGGKLFGLTDAHSLVEINPTSGERRELEKWEHGGLLVSDGVQPVGIHDGNVTLPGGKRMPLTGRPVAAGGGGGHVFVATKEGPLWQFDTASGRSRKLGLGDWWGALAIAVDGQKLFVATQSGKLWEIDYGKLEKNALAMDGWQAAIGMAVSK
jgi:hypothetical protein